MDKHVLAARIVRYNCSEDVKSVGVKIFYDDTVEAEMVDADGNMTDVNNDGVAEFGNHQDVLNLIEEAKDEVRDIDLAEVDGECEIWAYNEAGAETWHYGPCTFYGSTALEMLMFPVDDLIEDLV